MRRYRLILDLFALFIVGVLAYAVFVPSREPSYQGRSLSSWVLEASRNGSSAVPALKSLLSDPDPFVSASAANALRAIDPQPLQGPR